MAVIDVTESAAKRIHELLEKDGKLDTHRLRMKVIGGAGRKRCRDRKVRSEGRH